MPIKWTPQQADIINAIGRVYVTASAGTGKTAVLTEKAIKLIRDGVSVDKILLITFTVAAAGEMKQRIFEALKKEYLACDSQSLPFIRRQLQLIDNAKICTIHSFCSSVISEFFFKVGLTPAFRIAEQFEMRNIEQAALEETINSTWADPKNSAMLRILLDGRRPEIDGEFGFLNSIIKVNYFCESLFSPEDWLDKQMAELNSNADLTADANAMSTLAFITILKEFRVNLFERKRRLGVLDYNDLEHLTLKILSDEDCRRQIQQRYNHIFVDEFQDVNGVQNKIVDYLDSGSLFLVGDVKQSIYSFRMARPDLYLERIETANEKESKALSANFRSRSDVINYANMIFEQIMTEESSMIDYSKGHSLESRGSFGDYALQGAQIQHFYLQTDATHKIRKQAQAKFVIGKVQELLNGGEVYDSSFGGMRPVRYGDIAILKRKIKGDAEIYVEQFRKAGIPVTVSGSVEIKDTDEFRDITALLTILDNNTDQIALATVLRSPFYSFADSELAELAFDGPLKFSSLERYSGDYQGLKDKIEAFLSDYNSLREHAYKISLPELVWKIVNLNQYISFATMMQGGKFRRANLLAIHNLAERYSRFKSQMGSVSLQSFLNYLEGLSDKESGDLVAEQVDAVSIQSFHKSKGLEYPIVILPDLETNFRGLSIDDVVCDEKLGLALRTSINEGAENTAQFDKIRQEQLSQQIDEERRLLYVAVTRAKEKLILVAAGADPDKTGDGKSYWDWIRPCVSIEVVSPDDLQDLGKTESSISSGSKDSMLKLLCDNSQLARLVVNPKLQPVKMSASSINHDENAFPLRAFANDAKIKTMVDPRVRGTAVHLIFENTIKLRRRIAPKDVIDIISKLQTEALLTEDIANTIDVDSIVSFFETEIGQDSLKEKSYSEWPFTAYIDRSEFEDLKSGKVIVQGVVDLLIDYGDYVRIVDFKTDNITHQTMQPRVDIYAGQLKAYSIAAERVLGKPVRSSMLYFVTIKELIAL